MKVQKDYFVTFTAPEKAELVAVDRDMKPLMPQEVAGRTVASVISQGTELAIYRKTSGQPTRTGYAAVFKVEETGSEVTKVKPGDIAFCMGNHGSYQRHTQDKIVRVPDRLSAEVAVFARLMGISMSTLVTTTARPPQKVVVTGLGIVGHLAAKIFQLGGYDVTACDPAPARREIALKTGIKNVLPAVPVEDPEFAGHVALVVECSGHEQGVLDACKVVQKRGEVTMIGVPWERKTEIYAHELLYVIFHKFVVLRSGWEWELALQETEFRTGSIFGNFAGALKWLTEGRIKVDGLYAKVSPKDPQKIYKGMVDRTFQDLTAVFDWTDFGKA
jgi:threonine dehydrogenase-like Zn-dependent dehydrogenase